MKVVEIAFVGYPVTDLPRARRFYEGTLGLVQSHVFGNPEETAWIEYDIGPGTLAIGNGIPEWQPSPQGCTAALEVDDFEAAMDRIKGDGVPIVNGPEETPICHMVVVSDPDGNSLIIHKRKEAES
jgi:catechol 2,3-dioxygenase-like lactoylglutathione lyase family enzyme